MVTGRKAMGLQMEEIGCKCQTFLSLLSGRRKQTSDIFFPSLYKFKRRLKQLPEMRETWVRSLSREDPLEKEMAAHSSILAWRIPWMEEPSRLQSMGSQRVRHDWATSLSLHFYLKILCCHNDTWFHLKLTILKPWVNQCIFLMEMFVLSYANVLCIYPRLCLQVCSA